MIESINFEEIKNFAEKLAIMAGDMMKEAQEIGLKIETKTSFCDLVTETDKAIENKIRKLIMEDKRFQNHKFIGEESVNCNLTNDMTWIVDPIDGTNNFVHNYPCFCVSIGVTYNKKPIVGVIFNPFTNEMFTAISGKGAFKNGKKLSVSSVSELKKSLIIAEYGGWRSEFIAEKKVSNNRKLISNVGGIRMNGSAALNLCYVAEGRAEAYLEFGIHVWDYTAGVVIAEEAGAIVLNPFTGGEVDILNRSVICACNKTIADEILNVIECIHFERDLDI